MQNRQSSYHSTQNGIQVANSSEYSSVSVRSSYEDEKELFDAGNNINGIYLLQTQSIRIFVYILWISENILITVSRVRDTYYPKETVFAFFGSFHAIYKLLPE